MSRPITSDFAALDPKPGEGTWDFWRRGQIQTTDQVRRSAQHFFDARNAAAIALECAPQDLESRAVLP